MNRQHKVLLLILAMICVFSLCVISAGANEAEITDPGMQPAQLLILTYNHCRTEYTEGELFDVTGFRGYVSCYDPQYSFYIEEADLEYLETAPLTPDVTEITFVYGELTQKVQITVTPSEIVGFEVSAAKTEFLALEMIDPSVFTLEAIHVDGIRTPLDADACIFHPALDEPLSAQVKALTVTYTIGGKTFSDIVEISVSPILRVDIEGLENAFLYEGMEPRIPSGLTVKAVYDEAGTVTTDITNYDVEYPYDTVVAGANGKTVVTLIIDSQKIDVEVSVASIANYIVSGFKDTYYYGDSFSYANAQVTAIYGDGTTRDVTSEVQFTAPSVITADSKITAFHNGYDLTQHLPFKLPVGKLTVINPPAKLQYEIGEIFDSTGLQVAIEYSDGERALLDSSEYTLSVSSPLSSNDRSVSVGYYGLSEKISISVGNDVYITNLYLIGTPDVMSYYEGNLISVAGIVIEAYYSDGTKERIDPRTLNFTPSLTTPLTEDVTSVKISTGDGTDRYCEVSYPITVKDKHPTSLVPMSMPTKLNYAEGEKFNPDGLELRLFFNDGTYIVPSTYDFSPALGTPITLRSNTTEKIIIHTTYEYEGVVYSYPIEITVTHAEIENLLVSRAPVKTVYEIGEQFDPAGLEIIIIYKDRSLTMTTIPEGYYTYSPSVITETTTEIVFSFRGMSVSLPITVNGVEITDVTTSPIDPPVTTEPITPPETSPNDVTTDITTEPPEVTTEPAETTAAPEISADPETTTAPEITTSPDVETTEGGEDTDPNSDEKKEPSSLLFVWIIVIVIIVIALVALIIYYKKNFT